MVLRKDELEGGVKLWEEFEAVTTPLNEWIEKVEIDVQGCEVFGNTLEEAQQFRNTIEVRVCGCNILTTLTSLTLAFSFISILVRVLI